MAATSPEPDGPRWKRMAPDERREQILAAARRLFSERPYSAVSTADIASAAGVARSLVHHYFGGIRDVFLAVVADGAAALSEARSAGPDVPFEERTAHNIAASLDVIDANRETWLAVAGHGTNASDPDIAVVVAAAQRQVVDRTLAANSDIVADTPAARFAIECFSAFTIEAVRGWLRGDHTRAEVETLLLVTGRALLGSVIPALERP